MYLAKVIKLDTDNNSNGSRQSKINSNGHSRLLAKRVECQKGGVGSKQVVIHSSSLNSIIINCPYFLTSHCFLLSEGWIK